MEQTGLENPSVDEELLGEDRLLGSLLVGPLDDFQLLQALVVFDDARLAERGKVPKDFFFEKWEVFGPLPRVDLGLGQRLGRALGTLNAQDFRQLTLELINWLSIPFLLT